MFKRQTWQLDLRKASMQLQLNEKEHTEFRMRTERKSGDNKYSAAYSSL